jgi:RHS repeat-associated protein
LSSNSGTYTIGANNQTLSDGTFNYGYDREGNRVSKTRIDSGYAADYTVSYVFDNRNRLTTVINKDNSGTVTQTAFLYYDMFDHWVGEVVASGATIVYGTGGYSNGNVIAARTFQYDGDEMIFMQFGSRVDRFLHGPVVDMILANDEVSSDGQDFPAWLLSDQQNSVKTVLGSDGVTVADYTAFGQVKQQAGTGSVHNFNPLLTCFTGQAYDEFTGLQNNWHRWYDAALSQWLSEDPIGFGGHDTNLRRYVGNGPTNGIDPSGQAIRLPPGQGIYNPNDPQWQQDLDRFFYGFDVCLPMGALGGAAGRTAAEIIAAELKGSVNREFPSQYLGKTLAEIKKLAKCGDKPAQRALKILTDGRFKK